MINITDTLTKLHYFHYSSLSLLCMDSDKHNITYLPLQCHTEQFHCPKNPIYCTHSSLHSPHQTPGNHWSYCLQSLAFSRMACSWNHKYPCFSDWLLALSNMHLRFFKSFHSFLLLNNFLLRVPFSLFTHSPTEGHLSCFQFRATMNKAIINIHVHIFMWMHIFYSFK